MLDLLHSFAFVRINQILFASKILRVLLKYAFTKSKFSIVYCVLHRIVSGRSWESANEALFGILK